MTKHTDTKDTQDILNPKTDWVFKLMFSKGEEGNKALISFLNAFLQETYGTIKKADILNTELTRRTPAGETYHLDLLIKTDNGLIVNLEMQQGWESTFIRRSQLYLIRTAARFLKKKPQKGESFYAISLTLFGCDVPKKVTLPVMQDEAIIQFIYVELNKVVGYTMKKNIAEYTAKDFWIRFLGNYAEDRKSGMLEQLCQREEGIQMAERALFTVTEEERRIARELSEENYQTYIALERAEAREEGLSEGLEQGIQQGFSDGSYQTKLKTAKILKQLGDSVQKIMQATGLTKEEVETISF